MTKSPLAIWITDTHLSENTIAINQKIYSQVLQLCIDYQIPAVIHGGDIFDSRKAQTEQVLTTFTKILSSFSEHGVKLFAIAGNHDKSSLIADDSFLNPFSGWDCFHLYRGYDYVDHTEKGIRFHFIPYFDEQLAYGQYLDQAIKNIRFDFKNILFTHVAVSGVVNNDGSKINNDINASLFKHFFFVLVGHYHNRQLLSNNILYTGSTHQANFGEDEQKGCTVIYDDGSIDFIQLDFPKYITIEGKKGEAFVPSSSVMADGDHYRVKLKYKPTQDEVQKMQSIGIKVMIDYEKQLINHTQDVKTQFSGQDISVYFDQWCQEKQIEDRDFGVKQLQL